jgi:hypothetical protein
MGAEITADVAANDFGLKIESTNIDNLCIAA